MSTAKFGRITAELLLTDFLIALEVGPAVDNFLKNPLRGRFEQALLDPVNRFKIDPKDTGKGVFQVTNEFCLEHYNRDLLVEHTNLFSTLIIPIYPKLSNVPIYQFSAVFTFMRNKIHPKSFVKNVTSLGILISESDLLASVSNYMLTNELIQIHKDYHKPYQTPSECSVKRVKEYVRALKDGLFLDRMGYHA